MSSKHLHSQAVRARELTFWEKVHLLPPVTCHVSHVKFFVVVVDKVVKLVGGGSIIRWHVTCDTWHVICDTWKDVNILSKFQVPSSYGFGLKVCRRFGGKDRWLNEWMSDKGDCRIALHRVCWTCIVSNSYIIVSLMLSLWLKVVIIERVQTMTSFLSIVR